MRIFKTSKVHRRTLGIVGVLVLLATTLVGISGVFSATTLSISVSGTHLVDGAGNTVQLHGVNRSGTEYACSQGWGIFDGPSDAASVQAIAAWHANVVRVPLNEDCWLGINGVSASYSGTNYRNAITNYVNLLNANGLYAIVELHWSAPGTTLATGQNPMPDADHSPAFWNSVASTFSANLAVVFDLFNEPYPDNNSNSSAAWSCWKNGGTCSGVSYQAVGMQTLVNTVRSAGATNVIMLGGVQYSGTLDQWGANKPTDAANQLAASFHTYNFTSCTTSTCWNNSLAAVGNVPLVTGEVGETDGLATYINSYTSWADAHGVSYLAWTWNLWGCGGGIALITDYTGTPCPGYGVGYKTHLASLATTTTTTLSPATTTTQPAPPLTTTTMPATTTTTRPMTTTTLPTTTTSQPSTTTTQPAPPLTTTTTVPSSSGGSIQIDKTITRTFSPTSSFYSPSFSTSSNNELLIAFISADGPGTGSSQSVSSVSGGGLTWSRASQSNGQAGDAEIWTAFASSRLSKTHITANLSSGGYEGSLTVMSFTGTSGPGAATSRSGSTGSPNVSLITTKANSLVFGVGHDWDAGISRTAGTNQSLISQFVDSTVGDTSWVQRQNAATPLSGTSVSLTDSAPNFDQFNYADIEIRSA